MNEQGRVVAIHTAPEANAPMQERSSVRAVAGTGLEGDRYFDDRGTFSQVEGGGRDITLTEAEAIEAIDREADISIGFDEHRRNVTTRNTALNHLVGERFRIGDVVCEGVRLCEPCDHLRRMTVDGIETALRHRGGLRADILEGGIIHVEDPIERLPESD
ncbi:MAG: MOSC domain-containing protein [Halobacteriota archaeon]